MLEHKQIFEFMIIKTINPATEAALKSYRTASGNEIRRVLQKTDKAFGFWRRTSVSVRAGSMRSAAVLLRGNRNRYAELMALEMGKPVSQGRAECEKCAVVCDYFADNAERFLAGESVPTESAKSFVSFQPLGVILAIMPWNFPFWQVFRCAVPALMAGNVVLLKPASNVAGCGLAVQQIFDSSGLPEGVFNTLLVQSEQVADLIKAPSIRAVTLTGSAQAGRAVAAQAGAQLKKTVLELGGSDPYVVLEDCDLEKTVETCVASRLINNGQSCIAAKRFIVAQPILRKFEALFIARMNAAIIGDPLEAATTVGPLARQDLRRELHSQVRRSITQGARLLSGGGIPKRPGWFYPPTVLTDVRKGMPICKEETFGPVAAIIPAKDETAAIRLANDSTFGLGAAVFTQNLERGERIATEELEAGNCFVNEMVRSDPRLSFGGIKESGYGRELGIFGIREFVNIKAISVSDQHSVP
jgi:succinate-semialdehyde dehydrogenase/glutarate-semialdehyde dehydrogenase